MARKRKRTRYLACDICSVRMDRRGYCAKCKQLIRDINEILGRGHGHGPGSRLDRVSDEEEAASRAVLHRSRTVLLREVEDPRLGR